MAYSETSRFLHFGVVDGLEDGPGEYVACVAVKDEGFSSPEAADEDYGLALVS